ncbi:hypothetical protein NDN08_005238 [Rhodosorus marinus]|uniref:Uncharacterized protein n=1 Tax=Rhodosorus marinus TaxID=101924 RepID=A0AAV8V4K2_9RHOD|nr:hypothetical protein NDN08_005238 [Rhodosorus marinus]
MLSSSLRRIVFFGNHVHIGGAPIPASLSRQPLRFQADPRDQYKENLLQEVLGSFKNHVLCKPSEQRRKKN